MFESQKRNEYKNIFREPAYLSLKLNYGQHFDLPGLRRAVHKTFAGKEYQKQLRFIDKHARLKIVFQKYTNCAVPF
jgi:hypothetical protein